MNPATDALAGLRDIHLPEAVSYWPPAPGWWFVLLCVLGAAIWAEVARRRRARSPERLALAELERLSAAFESEPDGAALASGLSEVLRRVSLLRFDAAQVAAVYGEARAASLCVDEEAPGVSVEFIERLEEAAYAGPRALLEPREGEQWIDATRCLLLGLVRPRRFARLRRFVQAPRTAGRSFRKSASDAARPSAAARSSVTGSLSPVGRSS